MTYNHVSADQNRTRRYDIYAIIHKGIRRFMFDTLDIVGTMDCDDAENVKAGVTQVRLLADFCRAHFEHENAFIHPAMEERRPGSSSIISEEHEHHAWAIEQLQARATEVERTSGAERATALMQLYRYLAVFVGENLVHMNVEETEHNAILWATHTDAELIAIEQALVASLAPHEAMVSMQWMIPAMNPHERATKLQDIRTHAPAPVFQGLMEIARERLSGRDMDKLTRALATPQPMAA